MLRAEVSAGLDCGFKRATIAESRIKSVDALGPIGSRAHTQATDKLLKLGSLIAATMRLLLLGKHPDNIKSDQGQQTSQSQ